MKHIEIPAAPIDYYTGLVQLQLKLAQEYEELTADSKRQPPGSGISGLLKTTRFAWEAVAAERERIHAAIGDLAGTPGGGRQHCACCRDAPGGPPVPAEPPGPRRLYALRRVPDSQWGLQAFRLADLSVGPLSFQFPAHATLFLRDYEARLALKFYGLDPAKVKVEDVTEAVVPGVVAGHHKGTGAGFFMLQSTSTLPDVTRMSWVDLSTTTPVFTAQGYSTVFLDRDSAEKALLRVINHGSYQGQAIKVSDETVYVLSTLDHGAPGATKLKPRSKTKKK